MPIPAASTSGSRTIFQYSYPVVRVWGRMTNNTASTISVDVYYGGNLGSDGGLSQLIADSEGNGTFDPTDWWTLTDDGDGGGDSALLRIRQQSTLPFPFSVDSNNVDNHYLRTGDSSSSAVTVGPCATTQLPFFEEMALFRATLLQHVNTDGWYADIAALEMQDLLGRTPSDGCSRPSYSITLSTTVEELSIHESNRPASSTLAARGRFRSLLPQEKSLQVSSKSPCQKDNCVS